MKIMFKSLVALFAVVFATVSFAAADVKIAVIDVQEILQKAPQIKKINDALTAKFKPRQEKILAQETKLKQDMQKQEKNGAVLSATEKSTLQNDSDKQKRELQRLGQDYQQDLTGEQNQAMQQFFTQLKTVIDKIAQKEQYALILQKEGVPYAASKIDITQQVLKELS